VDGYEDDIPPSELARERRRDHDAAARERAGMNTGLAKQFKQVLDSQRRRAEADEEPRPRKRGHGEER
jgi:hypothetical protein